MINQDEQRKASVAARLYANELHCSNPEPGDYWHESFTPYLLVVKVEGEKIYVLLGEDRQPARIDGRFSDSHWIWDVTKHRVIDRAELRKMVTYQSIQGFVADVYPGRCLDYIPLWKEYNIKRLNDSMKEFE
jgi:hypothetical protein